MMHRSPGLLVLTILLAIGGSSRAITARDLESSSARAEAGSANGALVICGGGKLPSDIIDRFVELAGGEEARIVFIPTAADKVDLKQIPKELRGRKFASLMPLHTLDREEANADEFVAPLKQATGVWIVGGQQYRIADAYLDTAVERELYELLKRGGAIAGTSAGAAIQSRVMIAGGNPKPKMATGFDFLRGTIIDQHFTERKRQPRLRAALRQHPKLLGVGIDEDTAILVKGDNVEVLGRNEVHFYDPAQLQNDGGPTIESLKAGGRYDLNKRKVNVPGS